MWRLVTDGLDVLGCTVQALQRRVPRPVPGGHSIPDRRAEAGQVTELYMTRLKRVTERTPGPAPLNQFRHNPTMPGQAARCHA
jgi:hypothetical protein